MQAPHALRQGRARVQIEFEIAVAWARFMQSPASKQGSARAALNDLEARRARIRQKS